jgi:transposase
MAQAAAGRRVRLKFQDESRFGRINKLRRCWAPPGLRPTVCAQIVREFSNAFAAVSPHDGALVSLVLPRVNSDMMTLFLQEVTTRFPDEFILMIVDGASWHSANDLVVPATMRLLPLPPYSPELNPVESLWDEIREKYFPNLVFDSLDAVEQQLVEGLAELEMSPEGSKA